MELRSIPGQPGYLCGADGSVWSEKSGVRRQMKTFRRGRQGHMGVNLSHDGRYRMHSVHQLVAVTFLCPAPTAEHVVMHLDDDPAHNAVGNLAWGLPKENSAQMVARGRQASGERNAHARLSWKSVREIRRRIAAGEKQNRLAAEYGVSTSVICDIKLGRIWREN